MSRLQTGLRALMYGYVIRVFPVVSLAGFVVSAYGWFRLYQWFKSRALIVALVGVLAVIVLNVALALTPPQQVAGLSENMTSSEMVNALVALENQLESPLTVVTVVVPSIGLLFESTGLILLRKLYSGRPPLVAPALLIAYSLLLLAPLVYLPWIEAGIKSVRESLLNGSLNTTTALSSLGQLYLPFNIVEFAVLFTSLLAYIVLAYFFYNMSRSVEE
ncbi:hypothetical protein WLZ34_05965 [Thermogladius sp. KZ2Tp1]|uniref:hypothetical protein n=1 Tax=Thermogladius sp. KZ2Tp1 TaxID=3136289 RepID=UPI003DA8548E